MLKKEHDETKVGLGLLYALGLMMGRTLGLMSAVVLRMITDPYFGLVAMLLLVSWLKYVLTQ